MRNRYEGRTEQCPLTLLDGRTLKKEIAPGFPVTIPERSLLLLLKMKAAWDRAYRIQERISHNEDWENGKLRKDRADILSLIDPEHGGAELDFMFLGNMMHSCDFLAEILTIIPNDRDALRMYGRMNREDILRAIGDVIRLTR